MSNLHISGSRRAIQSFLGLAAAAVVITPQEQGRGGRTADSPGMQSRIVYEPGELPTNILLIVLDDLGTDQLSIYGQTPENPPILRYPSTPTLTDLATEPRGIFFRNYFTNPVCSPSRVSLMTGRFPFRTGMGSAILQPNDSSGPCSDPCANEAPACYKLDENEIFIPELLKKGFSSPNRYRCGAFGKWHMAYRSDIDIATPCSGPTHGLETHAVDNGFDRFYGTMGNPNGSAFIDVPPIGWQSPPCLPQDEDHYVWRKVKHNKNGSPTFSNPNVNPATCDATGIWSATDVTNDALAWINSPSSKPFFAYVAYNPPHTPRQLPPSNLVSATTVQDIVTATGSYVAGAKAGSDEDEQDLYYRAMIESVDHEIGRLRDGIDQLDRTMIIVVADNGTPEESLTPQHTSGHGKASVYNFGVRVPMIVNGPLVELEPSTAVQDHRSDALVSVVDLWSTIGAIAGADENLALSSLSWPHPDLDPTIDSQSFLPALLDRSAPGREYAFSQRFMKNGWYCGDVTAGQTSCFDSSGNPRNIITFGQCGANHGPLLLDVNNRCLVMGELKYVRNLVSPSCPSYQEELYLLSDLEETNNLVANSGYASDVIALRALTIQLSGY